MRHLKPLLATATVLLATTVFLANRQNSNYKPPIEVAIGEQEHSTNTLTSKDFVRCSALIIDYGPGAILAHAMPISTTKLPYTLQRIPDYGPEALLYTDNVVGNALLQLDKLKIPRKGLEARIHAGEEKGLRTILKDLQKAKVTIRSYELAKQTTKKSLRNIQYNPKTNHLQVHYH